METFSALLALCVGNSPVTGEFPSQRSVTRSFGISFDLHLNKRLSEQSWRCWFETRSLSLWCHCNVSSGFIKDIGFLDLTWIVLFVDTLIDTSITLLHNTFPEFNTHMAYAYPSVRLRFGEQCFIAWWRSFCSSPLFQQKYYDPYNK